MADPSVNIQITAEDMTQAVLRGITEGFKRVESGIKQSAAASSKSADSLRQVATSAKGAEAGIEGLISRFGGLAAAAAAAGATIKSGISDALELDRLNTKFKAASGSAEEAGFAMQYVREESKRLGLDVRTTADNFGRLLIATKNTALEGEGAREIFTGFGTAFTALGVTSDEAGRIFQQMTQGINKGKVELEDAKIIAEAGIPIFDLFAQAIGKSRPEIMKMISDGQLTTDIYLKVAESLDKAYGADAAARLSGTEKQYQLMKNELFETSAAFGKDLLPAATMVIKVLSGGIEVVGAFWKILKDLVSVVVATGSAMYEFNKLTMGGGMFSEEGRREFAQGMEAIKGMVVDQFNDMGAAGQKYHKSQEKLAEERAKSEKQRLKEAADQVAANKKASEDYFKLIADEEQRLLAKSKQEFDEKTTTVKNYFEARLKAVQKGSEEELKIQAEYKTALAKLEREKAAMGAVAAVTARKNVLAQQESIFNQEIALIEAKVAKEKGFEIEGSAIIYGLKVKQAKDEYDLAQQRVSILRVAGQTGTEEYKKSLDAMYKAHAAYLNESTAAYKKYADNIKAIDQQIKDFRSSIQDKIRDIQQRGMTDSQKYADDQKRFNEAIAKGNEAMAAKQFETALKYNKQAEELAGRLVDKKAESNTKLEQMEIDRQKRIQEIESQYNSGSKETEQQKKAAEIAKVNSEFEAKRTQELKEQAAVKQGASNAEQALNSVLQQGVAIREAQKQQNVDALEKLKQIQDMKLDPKNLAVNMDNAALESVKSQIAALTATETKTIIIKTVGASGEASYSNTGGAAEGFFAGGKVTNGSPLRDSVSAMLARDEWVINNKAAGFWGDNLLAAINAPLSSSGRRLQETLRSVPAPAQPNVTPMGTINLDIGGGSFPMSAPIDVLAELNTALRRRKMTRPNP